MSGVKTAGLEPIAGYRLIEPLGHGGFGEVWKCEAPGGLCKAVKFVHGDDQLLQRSFSSCEQELRSFNLIKTVRHPFLISVDRVEFVRGELVIVMELADRSLHDVLEAYLEAGQPGVPRGELLGYLRDTAEALDVIALEYGLQHLDVKPRNLFLVHGHAKLGDFGLVSSLSDLSAGTLNLGAVTPLYTAPESFVGRISAASDQYSLAIAYHELLTGAFPFGGTNYRQLALQHSTEPPDLSRLPEADRPVVARALAKTPGERFPSCSEFVAALLAVPAAPGRRGAAPPCRDALPAETRAVDSRRPQSVREAGAPAVAAGAEPPLEVPGYRLLGCVDRSPSGEVRKALRADGEPCFIKALTGFDPTGTRVGDEALRRLRGLRHAGLAEAEYRAAEGGRLVRVSAAGGRTLADRLRECRREGRPGVPGPELLGYLRDVARCLDDLAAEEGLHHLALTPGEVALEGGRALVQGFGLAELLWLPCGLQPAALSPRYAAPELFAGQGEAASDQYSLALIYIELRTGLRPLWWANTEQLSAQKGVRPDLHRLPPAERPVLLRALSADADRRYPSCRAFVEALVGAAAEGRGPGDTGPASARQVGELLAEVVAQARGELEGRTVGGCRYQLRVGRSIEHRCLSGLLPTAIKVRLHAFRRSRRAQLLGGDAHGQTLRLASRPVWRRLLGGPAPLEVDVRFRQPEGEEGGLTAVGIEVRAAGGPGAARALEAYGPGLLLALRRCLEAQPERRREERLPFPYPLAVAPLLEDGSCGEPAAARAVDISAGGMRLLLPSRPATATLLLKLEAPQGSVSAEVPARVVRVVPCADGTFDVGVAFRQDAPTPNRPARRGRLRLRLSSRACLAVLAFCLPLVCGALGLVPRGLSTSPPDPLPCEGRGSKTTDSPSLAGKGDGGGGPPCYRVEGCGESFATLADALAAAEDGATVTLCVDGPVPTPPLSCRGKALTLRAAPGRRPRLLLTADTAAPWRPLLDTDADLTLEGVDLGHAAAAPPGALLLHSEGPTLTLRDCRLDAGGGPIAAAHRRGRSLTLQRCRLEATTAALSVETGDEGDCRVVVEETTLRAGADGAALSLWSADGGAAAVRVELRRATLQGGRTLSLRQVSGRVEAEASDSVFRFGEALLSVTGRCRGVAWRGTANRYAGRGDWLRWQGQAGGVHGLDDWRRRWSSAEANSHVER